MSDDGIVHFSQESMSLLLTGGDTGVPLEHHIPITSSFGDSPVDFESKLGKLLGSAGSGHSSPSSYSNMPMLYTTASSGHPTVISVTMPTVPADTEIRTDSNPGSYEFDLKFEEKKAYAKNYPYCYSREKDTLIVKDHTPIPFTFKTIYSMRDLRINVLAVFSSKDNFNIPVIPCNNHSGSSQGQPREFIVCDNPNAVDVKEQERHHILLPLVHCRDVSGDGTEIVENFQFNCRSSCSMKSGSKGINNRQLSLIFQLETNDGVVFGRRVVYLKVAVSPGRDIATLQNQDSKRARKRTRTASEVVDVLPGSSSPDIQSMKKKIKKVKGTGRYSVIVNSEEWRDNFQGIANALDAKFDKKSECHAEWAEYIGDDPASQTSIATQENGSQPDQYSLEGWLARYGLESYTMRLEDGGFGNPTNFQCIQESDLDKLEIVDKCHRKTIIHAAKRILIRGITNIVKGEC